MPDTPTPTPTPAEIAALWQACQEADTRYRAAQDIADALRWQRDRAQDRHMAAMNARPVATNEDR